VRGDIYARVKLALQKARGDEDRGFSKNPDPLRIDLFQKTRIP
jgi:hypothetical protein